MISLVTLAHPWVLQEITELVQKVVNLFKAAVLNLWVTTLLEVGFTGVV